MGVITHPHLSRVTLAQQRPASGPRVGGRTGHPGDARGQAEATL